MHINICMKLAVRWKRGASARAQHIRKFIYARERSSCCACKTVQFRISQCERAASAVRWLLPPFLLLMCVCRVRRLQMYTSMYFTHIQHVFWPGGSRRRIDDLETCLMCIRWYDVPVSRRGTLFSNVVVFLFSFFFPRVSNAAVRLVERASWLKNRVRNISKSKIVCVCFAVGVRAHCTYK